MKKIDFATHDNMILKSYLFDQVENPKAVVQITHGMAEYAMRYEEFAKFLNKNGYIVFLYDQRGHGETSGVDKQGLATDTDFYLGCVKDQGEISSFLKERYEGLPLYIFGHSFGSFVTQKYIQTYPFADKVVLCGSAKQSGMLPAFGKIVAKITKTFKGKDAPAKMIEKLSFGSYAKKCPGESWLTRDKEEAKKYADSPFCGVTFSAGFYESFLGGVKSLYKDEYLSKIPKDLPLLIISGAEDGVGGFSKSVEDLTKTYLNQGITNVKMKLYPGMRHEILNEIGKEEVFQDVLNFFES